MSSADSVRVRILIVEDEARLANLLRLGLQEEGFGVDVVDDGEEAMAAAMATAFDLITLDVMLPGKEFAILEYFMHHPRRVLARAQIEEHVWDYDFEGSSNLVDVYMGRLRRKLAEAGAADHIVTLRGMGYRFDPKPGCASNSGGPESD